MISSISFVILSIVYNIILSVTFFNKLHIKTTEIKLFNHLLIENLIGLITEVFCYISLVYIGINNNFSIIINKLFLIYYVVFAITFADYFISIALKKEEYDKFKNNINIFKIFIFLIAVSFIILLPINFNNEIGVYSYGPSVNVVYIFMSLMSMLMVILFLLRFKFINKKKCIPVIAFIVGCGTVGIIQKYYPEITLSTPMEMLVLFIMYFTIENPDLVMIAQLNEARDQADRANNAKSEFLSNMSHEIRTPLNAIVGFSQALEEEDLPESAKEEVKDIIMASQSLLEIVNGILDISKIEANKLEIVNSEYDFTKVLDELTALTKARLGDKPLEFNTSFDPTIPKVLYGDHTRLKQIVLNLLTNAVKYTHQGHITFKVNSVITGEICRLIISVEDTGIGIKEQNIGKLFSKFERFDLDKNITIEGTGLGLAITKRLVDLMNGKIVVQSIYGRGSKFTVAIDQKIVKTPTIEIKQENKQVKEVAEFDISDKKILVVDDNKLNLKVAERLLKDYNVTVEALNSGGLCIDKIKSGETYDLILMDDMMPNMSGTETLAKLKQIEGFNIPTIALTANAITGMKEKYLKAGFDDYLSKPIDKLELNRIINDFLNK